MCLVRCPSGRSCPYLTITSPSLMNGRRAGFPAQPPSGPRPCPRRARGYGGRRRGRPTTRRLRIRRSGSVCLHQGEGGGSTAPSGATALRAASVRRRSSEAAWQGGRSVDVVRLPVVLVGEVETGEKALGRAVSQVPWKVSKGGLLGKSVFEGRARGCPERARKRELFFWLRPGLLSKGERIRYPLRSFEHQPNGNPERCHEKPSLVTATP